MTTALLLLSDEDCAFCGRPVGIFTRLDGQPSCARCWRRRGSPFPRPGTMAEVHAAETAARERMLKRNSADRHMVISGKS